MDAVHSEQTGLEPLTNAPSPTQAPPVASGEAADSRATPTLHTALRAPATCDNRNASGTGNAADDLNAPDTSRNAAERASFKPLPVETATPSAATGDTATEVPDIAEEFGTAETPAAPAPAPDRPAPLITLPAETQYRCPGEEHPISRAIHLSRLSAFYPACRLCQHRHDTGQLPPRTIERIQQVERRGSPPPVFQTDGVRGVFLNEFTPALGAQVAKAFASLLWERIPLSGRTQTQRTSQLARRGPSIAVGYDERPSSPAVLTAVVDALRMMGCPVTDVGLVSRPCFAFAVAHLQTAGGIFVTGSGCPASSTGLDLVAEGALPLSLGAGLDDVASRAAAGVARPTRRAGFQQSFQALVPYEAGLWKHFHALRPLRVVCAARPRPVRRTLRKLFAELPCRLFEVDAFAAAMQPLKHDVLLKRVSRRVVARQAHLGVLIDDDGARCWFLDERGRVIPSVQTGRMLARFRRLDHPNSTIVTESAAIDAFAGLTGAAAIDGGCSSGAIARAMLGTTAAFGCGHSDRYWWGESFPACDAILTLAHVLQSLSRSDAPFSTVLDQNH